MTSNNIDNEIEKCTYCTKIISKLSEFNKNRHITACKEKNGTPNYGNRQIKSFFSSGSSDSSVTSSLSTVNIQPLFSTSPCNTENDVDSSDPFNSSNESYDLVCYPIEENSTRESSKRPRNDSSSSESQNTKTSPSTLKESITKKKKTSDTKCSGYRGSLKANSFFEQFPFQLLGSDILPNIIITN